MRLPGQAVVDATEICRPASIICGLSMLGSGRDAAGNNTLLAFAWLAF